MQRIIILSCLAITCLNIKTYSQEKDSIFLYNGQVLIGEVHGANLGEISIDDIDLKMQSVKLYKIKILKIVSRFKIETVDKKIYYGFLKASSKNGWIDIVVDGAGMLSMPITNLFLLISMEKNFFK